MPGLPDREMKNLKVWIPRTLHFLISRAGPWTIAPQLLHLERRAETSIAPRTACGNIYCASNSVRKHLLHLERRAETSVAPRTGHIAPILMARSNHTPLKPPRCKVGSQESWLREIQNRLKNTEKLKKCENVQNVKI